MKLLLQSASLLLFWGLISCGQGGSSQQTAAEQAADSTATNAARTVLPSQHNCTLKGKVLEGNQLWIREKQLLVAIVADSSTYDQDLDTDSHRILEVYDTKNCTLLERKVLPVNVSADYPYYLSEITYNKTYQMVGIRGFSSIYCYDIESRQLTPAMQPKFLTERYGEDAQSGMIQRLEVWEDYLIGYAQSYGTFAFDMKNKQNPQAVLPFAEHKASETQFNAMFLMPMAQGKYQAIIPIYNADADSFAVNPIFAQPLDLNTEISRSARNNRFIVLREKGNNDAVAIDLQVHTRITLPADVVSKPTQEVLKWVRSNPQ